MPVHLIAAGEGSTVVGGLEKVRRVAPGVVAETLPGTTHFFPMERPDHVRSVIAGMLAKT